MSRTLKHSLYFGVRGKSGEIIVADDHGVWKARTLQRRPIDERWVVENANIVKREKYFAVAVRMRDEELEAEKKVETQDAVPRNFFITVKDLQEHGYSSGCPGCLSILRGKGRQGHSAACRKRFEDIFGKSGKVKRASERYAEYLAKTLEKDDEERKAKKARKNESGERARPDWADMEDDVSIEDMKAAFGGAASSGLTDEQRRAVGTYPDEQLRATFAEEDRNRKAEEAEEPEAKKKKMTIVEDDEDYDIGAIEWLHAEENDDLPENVFDEKSGELLDPVMVQKARREEVEFMKKIDLFEEVTVEECWRETGKAPIGTKFVDLNKGSSEQPDVRCRLVARDFKPKGEKDREDLFAAMPPLEAKKLLFRMAATSRQRRKNGKIERQKMMFIDVKKAHLYGKCGEDDKVYVSAPMVWSRPGMCWRLKRWLYGMRPAASAWEADYSEKLVLFGMKKGVSAPTVFFDPNRELRCVVHGDDFTFLGWEVDLGSVADYLRNFYELKVRGIMGGQPEDIQEITILNRRLIWKEGSMTYEADTKHAELICEGVGLGSNSNGLERPCVRATVEEFESEEMNWPLSPSEATEFRALVARANFLSLDRPDVQFAVKEACRDMSAPSNSSWLKLKRIARFLLEFPRLVWKINSGAEDLDVLRVYADADWAGCLTTRRSTSGGVAMLGGVALKHWSSTQATVALSSGEAEFTSLVKAAAEGLGIQSLEVDLGWNLKVQVHTDSSAAKSMASRSGIGKIRHLCTKMLWVQDAVKVGKFKLFKIKGAENSSDILTKPKSAGEMAGHLEFMGAEWVRRRERREPATSLFMKIHFRLGTDSRMHFGRFVSLRGSDRGGVSVFRHST